MSGEFGGWKVLSPGMQDEVVERALHLMASCDHEWTGWQWEPGDEKARGGFAKQCLRCQTWLYDVVTNAGLADRR
jgi:hypothetical protein